MEYTYRTRVGFIHNIWLIILLLGLCFIATNSSAFDSMIEFESRSTTSSGGAYLANLDDCFTSGKAAWPWEYGAFNNVCIPTMLSKTKNTCPNNSTGTWAFLATAGRSVVYYNMLGNFPIGTLIALLAVGIEYIIMVDICTNAYIVTPHEYINLKKGWMTCSEQGNTVVNTNENALSAIDVPFFYHCDPKYDPVTGQTLVEGDKHDAELIGRTWGYMGSASPYCADGADAYAEKNLIGKVIIHYVSGWDRFWSGMDRCKKGGEGSPERKELVLTAGHDKYQMPAHYHAYYRFNNSAGKVQICVVTPWTLLPIRVGCSYVPPPNEDMDLDQFIKDYLSGTRCYYFLTGRTDLWALGKSLPKEDDSGVDRSPIKAFLTSDLHITSTVVGCIQDLLVKVFISPKPGIGQSKSFFQTVQERLKQIVYAVLVLYISLTGIKIMTAQQVPSRGEFIMYVVKMGLVLYFGVGNAWYEVRNGEQVGIYPALISASNEIADLFMDAQNDNDPIGFCQYKLQGSNILSERTIPSGAFPNMESTLGQGNNVKLTIFDKIDCKVVNYLNLGSCKYTISGLVGVWIISAALFAGMKGFLLTIVSFIYCLMLLLIIFKFVHIFILSAFVITVLTILSPIFLCFALFEYTKGIFQKWMQMMLGYVLYPALLFAFIALMLATFDSIFFGQIDLVKHNGDIKAACADIDNDSQYCTTYDASGQNPCSANAGNMGNKLTTTLNLGPLGKFTILKDVFVDSYLKSVAKLMLFAFLFYLFLSSVSGFLAILTGVQDLGAIAKGSINLASLTLDAIKTGGQAAASGGANLATGAAGRIKSALSGSSSGRNSGGAPRNNPTS